MTAQLFDHVYLSPHLDDVAFSCAGSIASQRARGERILVFTVCAAEPQAGRPVARFAEDAACCRKTTVAEIVRARRIEDQRAMALLDVQYGWGTDLDIAFRLPDRHPSLASIFVGEVIPSDPLIASVTHMARNIAPGAMMHAPLGIGYHIDHRIVHAAARSADRPVSFYEDFPYVTDWPDALVRRLSKIGAPLRPVLTEVSQYLGRRIEATLAYKTQVGGLEEEIVRRIVLHAVTVGCGVPAERSWEPVFSEQRLLHGSDELRR